MSDAVTHIERRHAGSRMSQIVVHGGTIYIAGQVAADPTVGVVDQTKQILGQIDALLGEVGSDKTKLLSASVWLADVADYVAMNGVWDAWVAAGHAPARACVGSALAGPHYRIEIAVIAAR